MVPVFVPLSKYFDARGKLSDLSSFVREDILGQWHPDVADKEAFARELAQGIRDRRVVWLLDGYDELTPRERGLLNQELERLERFVLTTRRVRPESNRRVEATLHLDRINRTDALEFVSARYSPGARARLEAWCQRNYEAEYVLENGLLLDEAAKLADDPTEVLSLATVLERAITRQLSTRTRFQRETSADVYALARGALGNIAFESLNPRVQSDDDKQRFNQRALVVAWRGQSSDPESIFFEVVASTGLLLEDGEEWQFPSEFIRDELAAEDILREGFMLSGRALFPQFERALSFWAAKLVRSGQHQRVVDLLTTLQDQPDDPYGARWSLIVKMLAECLPFETTRLRQIRLDIEHALLDFWQRTSSNKMKMQISLWLLAIDSDKIPDPPGGGLENVARDVQDAHPQLELHQLLSQAGYIDLAKTVADRKRVDQQAVTHALIDVLSGGDMALIHEAAIYLTQRKLGPTALEKLTRGSPIDRLVELAESHPLSSYSSSQEIRQARAAQSAALAVLGRPEVLCDESLLKRIPDGIIHTLMADLRLRIRKRDNHLTIITADGREWAARIECRTHLQRHQFADDDSPLRAANFPMAPKYRCADAPRIQTL